MFFKNITTVYKRSWKDIARDMFAVFVPLIVFGGTGWIIDGMRGRAPVFLLLGVGIAFIVTNIFIFFRFRKLSSQMNEHIPEEYSSDNKN